MEESISKNEEKRFLSSGGEEEMSREDWSQWFSSQETLARTFESVGLPEDALIRWKEIDRALGLKKNISNSLGKRDSLGSNLDGEGRCLLLLNPIGPLQPNSDSNSILLPNSHIPFNETPANLLLKNDGRANLFALRCYIFSKRAVLLGELGRVGELMNETPGFLARVSGLLKWGERVSFKTSLLSPEIRALLSGVWRLTHFFFSTPHLYRNKASTSSLSRIMDFLLCSRHS